MVSGCPNPLQAPNQDMNQTDSAYVDDLVNGTSILCSSACRNLRANGCEEGFDVDGGDSCFMICAHNTSSAHYSLPAQCVNPAKDVAGIRACGVRCQK